MKISILTMEEEKFVMKKVIMDAELEADQESIASSEETESPTSVIKVIRKLNAKSIGTCVHSQILRIRSEDSHIGEDMAEILSPKYKHSAAIGEEAVASVLLFSRPVLRSSRLGDRTTIKTEH